MCMSMHVCVKVGYGRVGQGGVGQSVCYLMLQQNDVRRLRDVYMQTEIQIKINNM